MDILRVIAAYILPILSALAAGHWNPFPPGVAHDLVVPVAAALSTFFSLIIHPNGVNGPAKMKKVKGPPVKAVVPLVLMLGGALYAQPARAQVVDSPLTLHLNDNWSLHPNLSVSAFAYDVSQKQVIGEMTFSGLYVLDYKELAGLGLGLAAQSGPVSGIAVSGMLLGPKMFSAGLSIMRVGLLARYVWLGPDHDFILAVAPSIQF